MQKHLASNARRYLSTFPLPTFLSCLPALCQYIFLIVSLFISSRNRVPCYPLSGEQIEEHLVSNAIKYLPSFLFPTLPLTLTFFKKISGRKVTPICKALPFVNKALSWRGRTTLHVVCSCLFHIYAIPLLHIYVVGLYFLILLCCCVFFFFFFFLIYIIFNTYISFRWVQFQ